MFNNLQKSFMLAVCVFVAGNALAGTWVNWGQAKEDVAEAAHKVADSSRAAVETVAEKGRSAAETVAEKGRAAVDAVVEKGKEVKNTVAAKKNEYAAQRELEKVAQ